MSAMPAGQCGAEKSEFRRARNTPELTVRHHGVAAEERHGEYNGVARDALRHLPCTSTTYISEPEEWRLFWPTPPARNFPGIE